MDQNLRYKTIQYNANSIVRQMADLRLIIEPDFKDIKRWAQSRQSQFIESMIIGMPSQPIWCEETDTGNYLVIDGTERLRAIYEFLTGTLHLKQLRLHHNYNRLVYGSMPYHEVLNIEDRFQLPFVIINYDTQPELKAEFYWRLLESSDRSWKSQSARNFAYRGALYVLKKIRSEISHLVDFFYNRGPFGASERRESKADEVVLYLILFASVIGGRKYYVNENSTVENLLDVVMAGLDDGDGELSYYASSIRRVLDGIATYHGGRVRVAINSMSYGPDDSVGLHSFYLMFIKELDLRRSSILHTSGLSSVISPRIRADRLLSYLNGRQHDY
jgi:hypothetical protein